MTLKWGALGGLFFLQNIKPFLFGELKNCIGEGFWRFKRVYMNSSNLFYVVIIFLKLKLN